MFLSTYSGQTAGRYFAAKGMRVGNIHDYSVYFVTNSQKTALYVGVTNELARRLAEHWNNRGNPKTFAGKYCFFNLVYFESYQYITDAIAREKELKKWRRQKKIELIESMNPDWEFLNLLVCDDWPPQERMHGND